MKAAVLLGPKKIEVQERDVPELEPDELMLKVKAVGICGSDIAYYQRGMTDVPPPIIMGHEFTGEIVKLGNIPRNLELLKEGDKVVVEPVQSCGVCQFCKRASPNLCIKSTVLGVNVDGGFAEYCKAFYNYVHLLPENVSYEEGAFAEPLACAVYGVKKMKISPGDFGVVVGAGPIGLMMLQYIKAQGADKVVLVGTRDYRLEAGNKLGADYLINIRDKSSKYYSENPATKVGEWSDGGANAVIVATGNVDANELGISLGGPRSRIVLFGGAGYSPKDQAKINLWQATLRDMEIIFSWLSPYTFIHALRAIRTGQVRVKPLVTHTFPLNRVGEAIETAEKRLENALKVQVKP